MSAVSYEIHAFRYREAPNSYEPYPYKVLASGKLTATLTVPSPAVVVPDSGDDRLVLLINIDTTGAVGETIKYAQSYLSIAKAGQQPAPGQDPRFQVNGADGVVRVIVKPGQSFSILDSGRAFGSLTTAGS